MLRDPERMYPGQRRMQNYHFNDGQIDDLTAFLRWCGNINTQGFPPRPSLSPVAVAGSGPTVARSDDRPQVFNQLCVACHALRGSGGAVGPALDGVGGRYDAAYLERWLHDPNSVRPGTRMPRLPLSDAQVRELVAFLSQQRPEARP